MVTKDQYTLIERSDILILRHIVPCLRFAASTRDLTSLLSTILKLVFLMQVHLVKKKLQYKHKRIANYVKVLGNSKRISLSHFCTVLSGVPQGIVLGPLFFVIFINDLPEHVNSAIPFVFADDTIVNQVYR